MTTDPESSRSPCPIAVVILCRESQALVRRRPETDPLLGGTWEFPGGKIERGECAEVAARRELWEETGLRAPTLRPLDPVVHRYPDRAVELHFFVGLGVEEPAPDSGWRWMSLAELAVAPLPEANRPVVEWLRRSPGVGSSGS